MKHTRFSTKNVGSNNQLAQVNSSTESHETGFTSGSLTNYSTSILIWHRANLQHS